ncbi:hypothetical protein, partial [Campylobacter fetus]|uniref:hypothetical protein n=1 Tax=Campylobacter fetus TaxID=196 RepID=UPI003AF81826
VGCNSLFAKIQTANAAIIININEIKSCLYNIASTLLWKYLASTLLHIIHPSNLVVAHCPIFKDPSS